MDAKKLAPVIDIAQHLPARGISVPTQILLDYRDKLADTVEQIDADAWAQEVCPQCRELVQFDWEYMRGRERFRTATCNCDTGSGGDDASALRDLRYNVERDALEYQLKELRK